MHLYQYNAIVILIDKLHLNAAYMLMQLNYYLFIFFF